MAQRRLWDNCREGHLAECEAALRDGADIHKPDKYVIHLCSLLVPLLFLSAIVAVREMNQKYPCLLRIVAFKSANSSFSDHTL